MYFRLTKLVPPFLLFPSDLTNSEPYIGAYGKQLVIFFFMKCYRDEFIFRLETNKRCSLPPSDITHRVSYNVPND